MKITIIYVGLAVEYRQGSYAARNKGVELAKGKIIAFIDADCIPDKSWLERRYSYLVKSPKCHDLGGNVVSVLANKKALYSRKVPVGNRFFKTKTYTRIALRGHSQYFRKKGSIERCRTF